MLDWRSTGDISNAPGEVIAGMIALGVAALLLAPFLAAAAFRAGNLPNDGRKLGARLSTCSAAPCPPPHREHSKNNGKNRLISSWTHCNEIPVG